MKAQWVCNNESLHMANHRLALPWECSQLLGVCNAKMSRGEVENSKRKEGLSSRALHPRDYFLLEIASVLFTIFINSGLQWFMWDTPLWSRCCYFYHQLMTFVRERHGVRENCSSRTSCLCCAVPQQQLPSLSESEGKDYFSSLPKIEKRTEEFTAL